jgi:hypothetical protein
VWLSACFSPASASDTRCCKTWGFSFLCSQYHLQCMTLLAANSANLRSAQKGHSVYCFRVYMSSRSRASRFFHSSSSTGSFATVTECVSGRFILAAAGLASWSDEVFASAAEGLLSS